MSSAPDATLPPPSLPPSLPVVETFHSLQGEGLHAGRSAFFIRLAGCGVGCSWCDTRHSWNAIDHPRRSLAALAREAREAASAGAAFVVVSGGEPLEHPLDPLCAALRAEAPALPLHLETSGVGPWSGRFDWITLSPKRHRPPAEPALAACHELKVVVHEEADLAFAEAMAAQASQLRQAPAPQPGRSLEQNALSGPEGPAAALAPPGPTLLLQPGWNCRRGQELAVAFVQQRPAWRLSLQNHKWLGVR